jgi:hypothetical protein
MPEEIFVLLTLGLSFFGFNSIIAYIYWTTKDWRSMTGDQRTGRIFYVGLMLAVTILFSLIPIKVLTIVLK